MSIAAPCVIVLAALAWTALVATACGRPEAPNVLLITLDTTRADRLGAYGFEAARTPRLDAFARTATVYEHAYAASSWTLPSHASIFTGLLPMQHGAQTAPDGDSKSLGYSVRALDAAFVTLAERISAAGHRSAAVVAGPALARELGVDQGFERYDDDLSEPGDRLHGRRADVVASRAIAAIEAFGDEPWFVFVNFYDPHAPYRPPAPHDRGLPDADPGPLTAALVARLSGDGTPTEAWERGTLDALLAGYDAEIAYLDRHLGRLLGAVERAPGASRTWIAITADHGESFGEHGFLSHGAHLYEDNLRVPLLVRTPGRPPGRVPYPVSNRALFAEALDAAEVTPPADALRLDAPPQWILAEVGPSDANVRLFGDFFDRRLHALLVPPHKLITSSRGEVEIYDVAGDPRETVDLAGQASPLREDLAKRLEVLRDAHPPLFDAASRARLDPGTREALQQLGYLEPERDPDAAGRRGE